MKVIEEFFVVMKIKLEKISILVEDGIKML